ncbi:carbohydrate sulfotransferase 11-like isoform X2 [Penaeus japonicus]|uniref:carbohydrate sulfotransferase 11-like isoform X2 n=1 Tax=Penaeus japonicus TaxID=27405 RepID=UPI001C7136D6|nr:carbohydrate sulfotransferase 11-like isoform X2 [Penaeus japonicus]
MAIFTSLLRKGSMVLLVLLCMSLYHHLKNLQPSTMVVEEAPEPTNLVPTQKVIDRLARRRRRVLEVCHKYGFDSSRGHTMNSKEFLVNKEHGLIWCNVFKAASSTWLWNFNILAGYTEEELLDNIKNPLGMAREKYPRLDQQSLEAAMHSSPPPLIFMIVRHPFIRLVSAYRDKIARHAPPYAGLRQRILKAHPELGAETGSSIVRGILFGQRQYPSFPQFIQYIVDQYHHQEALNEHWESMFTYCTPCQANFTVFAKVETLDEDSNYIMHASGIQRLIKPRIINRAQDGSTEDLAEYFLCELTKKQVRALISLYKHDLEMFEYETQRFLDCASD